MRSFARFSGRWWRFVVSLLPVRNFSDCAFAFNEYFLAKYNEMEEDLPDLNSFAGIIGQDVPYSVALEYELWVLKQMGWKLNGNTGVVVVRNCRLTHVLYSSNAPCFFTMLLLSGSRIPV